MRKQAKQTQKLKKNHLDDFYVIHQKMENKNPYFPFDSFF